MVFVRIYRPIKLFVGENLRHDNLRDDWKKIAWIDIDEKWFYMRTRKKKKYHEEQKRTKTAIKSKRFIDKVMGPCAVGRPQGDFDGTIGIYRCSEKRQAERTASFTHAASGMKLTAR